MTDSSRIAVLVGSLRADSVNRRLAEALREQAPAGATIDIVDGLGDVPFYNEDLDGDAAPAAVVALRNAIAAADRVLIVTPEYNGTMPAVINNAIDWASRPFGAGAIKGKPVAVVGTSVGQFGGKWAIDDTRRSAGIAGADVVEAIELAHPYAWGTDPSADADTVAKFLAAVAELTAYQPEATAA